MVEDFHDFFIVRRIWPSLCDRLEDRVPEPLACNPYVSRVEFRVRGGEGDQSLFDFLDRFAVRSEFCFARFGDVEDTYANCFFYLRISWITARAGYITPGLGLYAPPLRASISEIKS